MTEAIQSLMCARLTSRSPVSEGYVQACDVRVQQTRRSLHLTPRTNLAQRRGREEVDALRDVLKLKVLTLAAHKLVPSR
jgi:hypothetical protein